MTRADLIEADDEPRECLTCGCHFIPEHDGQWYCEQYACWSYRDPNEDESPPDES
jgi:hypothetical protein